MVWFWILVTLLVTIDAHADGRKLLTADETHRFAAVGRLVSPAPGSFGTATRIDARRAVTSAHLLFHTNGELKAPLARVRFVGADHEVCAVRKALPFRSSPLFDAAHAAYVDLAVLALRCPGNVDPVQVRLVSALDEPSSLVHVGFHGDREAGKHLLVQRCVWRQPSEPERSKLRRAYGGLMVSDCPSYSGASGSPLFVAQEDERPLRLAGVVFAVGMPADEDGLPDWLNRYSLAVRITPEIERFVARMR